MSRDVCKKPYKCNLTDTSFIIFKTTMDEHTTNRLNSHTSVVSADKWVVLGKHIPKNEIVFLCQMIVIYTIVISAIINISLGNSKETWLFLLSTSLGAVLPSPKLKSAAKNVVTRYQSPENPGV